jgi:hypothetical protein
MSELKYCICPMSKNITDAVIELNSTKFALIPTRRQIDFDGGYVNNWNTKTFYEYVRSKSNIILSRDHGGQLQGNGGSDLDSYKTDAEFFDIIHIDPWKSCKNDFNEGIRITIETMNQLYGYNPAVKYEIGTEAAIRKFTIEEFEEFLSIIKKSVSEEIFDNIEYVVIQSGVGLDVQSGINVGDFDADRLKGMIKIVNSYGKKTKEHNGDYLSDGAYSWRFDVGVDSINIGPEIAQIETLVYLEHMTPTQIDEFYEICYNSKKWERWIPNIFDFKDKKSLIKVCGHYCFNLYDLPKIDDIVKEKIKNKLNRLP